MKGAWEPTGIVRMRWAGNRRGYKLKPVLRWVPKTDLSKELAQQILRELQRTTNPFGEVTYRSIFDQNTVFAAAMRAHKDNITGTINIIENKALPPGVVLLYSPSNRDGYNWVMARFERQE